jgi:hypothetical protein
MNERPKTIRREWRKMGRDVPFKLPSAKQKAATTAVGTFVGTMVKKGAK